MGFLAISVLGDLLGEGGGTPAPPPEDTGPNLDFTLAANSMYFPLIIF